MPKLVFCENENIPFHVTLVIDDGKHFRAHKGLNHKRYNNKYDKKTCSNIMLNRKVAGRINGFMCLACYAVVSFKTIWGKTLNLNSKLLQKYSSS